MSTKKYLKNNMANESVSKYKLLSAYGGPGSLVHTQYGSIIISCIEEWGFLNRILEIHNELIGKSTPENEMYIKVSEDARLERNGNIGLSNDIRLLESLKDRKGLINLKYLALIPDIEITSHNNKVKGNVELTIPSTYMPKVFADNQNNYKPYKTWHKDWVKSSVVDNKYGDKFHPPKYIFNKDKGWTNDLKQDNIILLCEHGHISDFPWSKFLRWRKDEPIAILDKKNIADIYTKANCCNNPQIKITPVKGNASGFDGKYLKCNNSGCIGNKGVSLKGIMGVKIKCSGQKPWEASTKDGGGYDFPYSGNNSARKQSPYEICNCLNPLKVALTTGNNIYYSRIMSSIYLHNELFESDVTLEIIRLEAEKKKAILKDNLDLAIDLKNQIKELERVNPITEDNDVSDSEKEMTYRYNEFEAFHKKEDLLSKYPKDLKVKVVTSNLDDDISPYFERVLRIDNMKITSAQLDFSRVVPNDADTENSHPKNIFRINKDEVEVYPVVESFGEGIFFSFNDNLISKFSENNSSIKEIQQQLINLKSTSNAFNKGAIDFVNVMNWQMYLVHTFSHLIMRELEFRCGYPTASLSERIYVSNENEYKMYGCLIYTAEGAEGSMGGLIAQTRPKNLNNLITSALNRATICNSDPLCWDSEGQGLFDLNFASCFSCSLVSETSCEHRNLYLDRKILVDENNGFFKGIINNK